MTFATLLTLLRILLVPVFMALVLSDVPYGVYPAAVVFAVAAATDGLDGYIARTYKQITTFGKLIDPIADKLLISAALITLVQLRQILAWPVVIIVGREFVVSGLRILMAAEGLDISASWAGKLKTVLQTIAVVMILLDAPGSMIALWLSVLQSVISGIDYWHKARRFI